MPKRTYLFLFVTALITSFLSIPSLTAADEIEDGQSLEITYIEYLVNDATVMIAIEGVAKGYQDTPELIVKVNEELRPVEFEYFDCLGNAEDISWETSYISEPFFWGASYDLVVIDPANEVIDVAKIEFPFGIPPQCSSVCGPGNW